LAKHAPWLRLTGSVAIPIDRGLILLRELQKKGFGVVKLKESWGEEPE